MLSQQELFDFLEEKHELYNNPSFIKDDPISVPHLFTKLQDVEISGFLAATIAWGQRKTIVSNAHKLMQLMDNSPYDFVINANDTDYMVFEKFVHRTFNSNDLIFFLKSLKNIYHNNNSLEDIFKITNQDEPIKTAIVSFRESFFAPTHLSRVEKHVSNPLKNAACKRINMFLRWMVRSDGRGVDFGLWKNIKPDMLICPLDVHTANISRKLGLLHRTQNDWQAAIELTTSLKKLDANDPIKYDFSLFGLGINEKF